MRTNKAAAERAALIDWHADDPTVVCTIAEAAQHTRISESSIGRALDSGELPFVRLNGARGVRRLRVVDVRRWIEGRTA